MPRLRRLLGVEAAPPRPALGGFVDGLLQTFENCRAGLSDAQAAQGPEAIQGFFVQLYEKEQPRLKAAVELGVHLDSAQRRRLLADTDELVRSVVIPAYARTAAPFIRRERNGFYVAPEPLHGLERAGWTVAGMLLGGFVVWAPFIPLWAKEWVLVFGLAGLVFPDLRRVLAVRRYQGELNRLVARADAEIWRLDLAYLTDGQPPPPLEGEQEEAATEAPQAASEDQGYAAVRERLASAAPANGTDAPKPRARQGGR